MGLSATGLGITWFLLLTENLRSQPTDGAQAIGSNSPSGPNQNSAPEWFLWTATGIFLLIIPLCFLLLRDALRPIRLLKQALGRVADGEINHTINPPVRDEFRELYDYFNAMTRALAETFLRAENANPLTGLPGNRSIRAEIEKRLEETAHPFAALYADLDNFKTFNDTYGLEAGDRAIKLTADLLKELLRQHGDLNNDFLGHEGGDDFVVVTTPERAIPLLPAICSEFDRRIQSLYSPEDLERGYLVAADRQGQLREYPLMTISVAVSTNAHRPLFSYAEVTLIWTQVKRKVKQMSAEAKHSTFLVDRRTGRVGTAADRTIFPQKQNDTKSTPSVTTTLRPEA